MAEASGVPLLSTVKERLREGKLSGFHCRKCGRTQATPMVVCANDGGREIDLVDLPDTGTIESFTVQVISSEEFINDCPFAFVVVKLDNGVNVTGWVGSVAKAADLPIGTKVRFTPSYKPGVQFERA
ncbi:MAG TPA: OB-fold domain-containing protein [Candidatus Thermoplasmatota archaeon]|nr:OB-fold domain-containing protein [Candidatus Thermoplasmatota archaeon]